MCTCTERWPTQLRKAADRRKTHRDLRGTVPFNEPSPESNGTGDDETRQEVAGLVIEGDGPLVVREKEFDAQPLTLAQALDEMELVGHDFFLFHDADTDQPSVVYRRRGWSYGVIHLDVDRAAAAEADLDTLMEKVS